MIIYERDDQRIVITDQCDGNLDYRFGQYDQVEVNRIRLLDQLAIKPEQMAVLLCEQKDRYLWVGSEDGGRGFPPKDPIACDGLITRLANIYLALPIADCFGLAFWSEGVKGILHLGRFGTELGLLGQAMESLIDKGFDLADLKFLLGPGIFAESYLFREVLPGMNIEYLTSRPDGKLSYDVRQNILDQLATLGINTNQLVDISYDTFTAPRQFSHRRSQLKGQQEGRFWMII
ncbi:polyphenol oxidase family protein [Candidatus Saccharibacteria bacterium]|nr:polyphenol oxidase family protein [Candidatus Saccharibacteria bacterium]